MKLEVIDKNNYNLLIAIDGKPYMVANLIGLIQNEEHKLSERNKIVYAANVGIFAIDVEDVVFGEMDDDAKVPFIYSGTLFIPLSSLKNATVIDLENDKRDEQYIYHSKRVIFDDVDGNRKSFLFEASREPTQLRKDALELQSLFNSKYEGSIDFNNALLLVKNFNIEEKE